MRRWLIALVAVLGTAGDRRRGRLLARLAVVVPLGMVGAFALAGQAMAAGGPTIRVCPSGCAYTTIAAAITAAPSGATITIAPGTYGGGLNTGNKNLKLLGGGASKTIISGGYPHSSIEIDSGTVTISGVTMTGGHGAIFNNGGTVTLNGSTLSGNAGFGIGGILNEGGTVTLNNSTVSSNNAFGADGGGEGGGIFNDGGTVRLNDSTVTGNTADGDGGGIYNQTGTVTLKDSTISGNNPDNCAPSSSIPGCTG